MKNSWLKVATAGLTLFRHLHGYCKYIMPDVPLLFRFIQIKRWPS